MSNFIDVTRSRKEVGRIFVKRDGEDSIRVIEGFLNSISVMYIDIDIKYPSMNAVIVESSDSMARRRQEAPNLPKQFQNSQYDIIHVAESTRFSFLSMMQSSCPIDRNIRRSIHQLPSSH